LLRLRERVEIEQILRLKNIATGEELDCKVADISRAARTSGRRWAWNSLSRHRASGESVPPVDWSQRSPEAKRFLGSSPEAIVPAKK
jgi:hypothetical protein